jgi:hypothetical protein
MSLAAHKIGTIALPLDVSKSTALSSEQVIKIASGAS